MNIFNIFIYIERASKDVHNSYINIEIYKKIFVSYIYIIILLYIYIDFPNHTSNPY
jgi:hypothetical protein